MLNKTLCPLFINPDIGKKLVIFFIISGYASNGIKAPIPKLIIRNIKILIPINVKFILTNWPIKIDNNVKNINDGNNWRKIIA